MISKNIVNSGKKTRIKDFGIVRLKIQAILGLIDLGDAIT